MNSSEQLCTQVLFFHIFSHKKEKGSETHLCVILIPTLDVFTGADICWRDQISADICRYLPNLSPISNTACLPIIHSSVALPSHAIPSPASAAARWQWTWWGRCRPWLSLLLTSGCSSTPIGTIIMMSPMEIVATLVGSNRAMVDLATLCKTPHLPPLASPTAAAGRSGSHTTTTTRRPARVWWSDGTW